MHLLCLMYGRFLYFNWWLFIILLFFILYFLKFVRQSSQNIEFERFKVRNFAHERDVYDYVQEFCSEIHNWCWGSTRSGEWKFAISVQLKEESYDLLIEFRRFLPVPKICSRNTGISKRVLACIRSIVWRNCKYVVT